MTESGFYKRLLQLDNSWDIKNVDVNMKECRVTVNLIYLLELGECPFTKEDCKIYDLAPERTWRHLDTMQYQTWLTARIPRVINSEGKVSTIEVPWADFSERYTHLFSSAVIQLLQFTKNQTKTAQFFRTSFDVINRLMLKAVDRGLERRDCQLPIDSIGIDEKSFKKGHQYCTIITDSTNKRILEVVADRTKEAAKKAIDASLTTMQKEQLKVVTGDMWEAYQITVKECLPKATYVLDRFHLLKYLHQAIDQTRRKEVKENPILKNARFVLLKKIENLTEKQHIQFQLISKENYMVSHVWRAKEDFRALFGQPDFAHAAAMLQNWFHSIRNFTIRPLIAVKEMFERHKKAVINSLCHGDSNAYAERMNGSIQELKTIAKGFRNVANFRTAILFHYGKLSLFPLKTQ